MFIEGNNIRIKLYSVKYIYVACGVDVNFDNVKNVKNVIFTYNVIKHFI